MKTVEATPANRKRRDRRIFVLALAVFAFFVAASLSWVYGPAYWAYWRYTPQEGDVVFQSLPYSRLVVAIEGATGSPFSHCGIVAKEDGAWVVYEAYQDVQATPLKEWLFRGRNLGFAVYRLKQPYQSHAAKTIEHVKEFVGRPYDSRYRMDDEHIYCSELIYKAYHRATGGNQLGSLVRLGDLNWRPYEATILHYEGGPVPLDRQMITPKHLAEAQELELVVVHAMAGG